jgi:hypothetical protein
MPPPSHCSFLNKIASSARMGEKESGNEEAPNICSRPVDSSERLRLLPDSRLHALRDLFQLFGLMYYAIWTPVRVASLLRNSSLQIGMSTTFIFDYILDFLFLIDSALDFTIVAYVSYESGNDELKTNSSDIRKSYLRSPKFKIDVLALLPFEILSLIVGHFAVFRLSKLVRVLQIPTVMSNVKRHLEQSFNRRVNQSRVSISLMFWFSVLLIVWISSGWYSIRESDSAPDSVYWAFTTLTTVGYGDIVPLNKWETVFTIIVGTIGATFSAAIIANVTSFFHDGDTSEESIGHQSTTVKVSKGRSHANTIVSYTSVLTPTSTFSVFYGATRLLFCFNEGCRRIL